MAACIENCRSQTSISPCLLESTQYYHMISAHDSLCRCTLWPCKPGFSEQILDAVCASEIVPRDINIDDLWLKIQEEVVFDTEQDLVLHNYYFSSIFSHNSLEITLANLLAMKQSNSSLSKDPWFETFLSIFSKDYDVRRALRDDLKAAKEQDLACISYVHFLLNFKGFQASQLLEQRISYGCKVGIIDSEQGFRGFCSGCIPQRKDWKWLLLEHDIGIVIGETAIIGDNVTVKI